MATQRENPTFLHPFRGLHTLCLVPQYIQKQPPQWYWIVVRTRMWSIRRQATRALTLFLRPLTQGEAAGQPKSCTRIRRPVGPRLAPLQGHMSGNEVFDSRKWRIPGPVSVSQCSRKEKEYRISEGSSWPHTLSDQTPQYPQPGTGGLPLGECCFDTICFDVYLQPYKSSEVFDILAMAKRTCNDISGWPEGSPLSLGSFHATGRIRFIRYSLKLASC